MERAMWEGKKLPSGLKCSCQPGWFGPKEIHRTEDYEANPILQGAREFVAGGEGYFGTTFERAFRKCDEFGSGDGKKFISQLGHQSVLPLPDFFGLNNCFYWEFEDSPSRLNVKAKMLADGIETRGYLKLYKLGILADKKTRLRIRYRRSLETEHISIELSLSYQNVDQTGSLSVALDETDGEEHLLEQSLDRIGADGIAQHCRITEMGVKVTIQQSSSEQHEEVILELIEIEMKAVS